MMAAPTNQRHGGFVMVPTLIVLALVAFLVAVGMDNAERQEAVARSGSDRAESFQAGQSALNRAEDWLGDQSAQPDEQTSSNCSHPCVLKEGEIGGTLTKTSFWMNNNSVGNIDGYFASTDKNGKYFIEYETYQKDTLVQGQKRDQRHRDFYRLGAYGEGEAGSGAVVVESVFAKRFR